MNSYKNLIDKLFKVNLFSGMKLGLKNMLLLNDILNYPANQFKTIHVAGSNGKGSVSTKIAKGLEESGNFKVGLYTSPHISCFRERIKINGEMISEIDVEIILTQLFEITKEHQIPCTFFELTTLLAFIYFAKSKVDMAVIETGLGGRLDATNIITPILSVITSISLDHTEILGNTIKEITLEKAGIIKPKIPVIIGPKVPFDIIQAVALKNKSPLFQVKGNFVNFEDENNEIAKNALTLLNISNDSIAKGLLAKPICRMEIIEYLGKTVILDVAHNPDGLSHLIAAVREKYPQNPLRLIFGLSESKDISSCLEILIANGSYFHLVSARNGRGLPLSELKKKFPENQSNVFAHPSIQNAIDEACSKSDPSEILLICGTFFIMSDARATLLIDEPIDAIDMNERKKDPL